MGRPSVDDLPAAERALARAIAERLRTAGHRAWIVGGSVRDLALGLPALDVDMASAATPEEIERLFERTHAVGKAFGTVVVLLGDRAVELTTFRSEEGYADGRRPDRVRFGATVEEDSARRDFTCNALYLDPLSGELADPQAGLADLERRTLRCIGDPAARFLEDGLRLARMARLAGGLDLRIDPATLAAARTCAPSLERVSVERRLGELQRLLDKPGHARAVRILVETELLGRLAPGQPALHPPDVAEGQAQALRVAALETLPAPPGLSAGLALLLDPSPRDPAAEPGDFEAARAALEGLRPSRATRAEVEELWRLVREAQFLFSEALAARSRRVRLVRAPLWPRAEALLRAWCAAQGADPAPVDELAAFAAGLGEHERAPPPLLRSGDLGTAGVPRGPLWRELLEEAETLQLDQRLRDRDQALRWLAERAAQVGGKARRRAKDSG